MEEEKKIKCEFCEKYVAINKKGLSIHRRSSKDCYNKWIEIENEKESTRSKVECEICGTLLRNISNTHLKKHNLTQQEYKEKFPDSPLFAEGLLEIQKNNREKTIGERYTPDEIKYLKGEKAKEEIIKKYGKIRTFKDTMSEDDIIELKKKKSEEKKAFFEKLKKDDKYNDYIEKAKDKRKETNLKKHGIEFPQKLERCKKKQKETLIKKYGNLEDYYKMIWNKTLKTRKEKYGKYAYFCPCFSIESQELFIEIEKRLPKNLTIFYATNGVGEKISQTNEYQVRVNNPNVPLRYLDFYIKEYNICIEFDENYHKYHIDDDAERENEIKESVKNLIIYRIKKEDFLLNKEKTVQDFLNFVQRTISITTN